MRSILITLTGTELLTVEPTGSPVLTGPVAFTFTAIPEPGTAVLFLGGLIVWQLASRKHGRRP